MLVFAPSMKSWYEGCSIMFPQDGGAHNGGGAWGAEWTARKVPGKETC